jgi:hypothetical protein
VGRAPIGEPCVSIGMLRTALIAALLASPAIAAKPDDEARLAKLLAGRTAGKPVTCLPLSRYSETRTIGSTVSYRVGGTWYVNRFKGGCPSLRANRILVSNHPIGQICSGDIANVVQQGAPDIFLGTCSLGEFTPYSKPR